MTHKKEPTPQAPGEEELIREITNCFGDNDLDVLNRPNARRLIKALVLLFQRISPSAYLLAAARAEEREICAARLEKRADEMEQKEWGYTIEDCLNELRAQATAIRNAGGE